MAVGASTVPRAVVPGRVARGSLSMAQLVDRARSVATYAVTASLVVGIAFAVVCLRPHRVFNGPVEYIVVSGTSMEPHFQSGDLVIMRRADAYHVGDIVAYTIPRGEVSAGHRVIHRIVGGSSRTGWITRGDNRNANDPWRVPERVLLGREWVRVPVYGTIESVVSVRLLIAMFVGAAVVLLAWPGRVEDDDTLEARR
jgi:signal peptidase I